MGKHFETIELSRQFLEDAQKLCKGQPDMRLRINKAFTLLFDNPGHPGLRRHHIANKRFRRLMSNSVTDEVRLLDIESRPDRLLTLLIDHHDRAYSRAETADFPVAADVIQCFNDWDASGQVRNPLVEDRDGRSRDRVASTANALEHLPRAGTGESNYACIPDFELMALGVADADRERIRCAPTGIPLVGYGISQENEAAIIQLYYQYSVPSIVSEPDTAPPLVPDTANDRPRVQGPRPPRPVVSMDAPVPIPLSGSEYAPAYTVSRPEQLELMMDFGLDRYVNELSKDQLRLAHLGDRGPLIIKGCAGSGKTIVALHRLKFLADHPARLGTARHRLAYLCYTNALARAAEQMLATLFGGQRPDFVEVHTLDGWITDYLKRQGVLPANSRQRDRSKYRRQVNHVEGWITAVKMHPERHRARHGPLLTGLSPRYIASEITEVIAGRGLATLDEYLNADRVGRGIGIKEADRRLIWELYEDRRAELERTRDVDSFMLPALALEHISRNREFVPYEAVVVDEAQDFTPVQLRLAKRLALGTPPSITIFVDAAQSIYGSGFRLRPVDLDVPGKQPRILNKNYRNTAQIFELASDFLANGTLPDERYAHYSPPPLEKVGPKPVLYLCPTSQRELEETARRISARIAAGTAPQNIAVLAGIRDMCEQMKVTLNSAGVATEAPERGRGIAITQPSVKILTMHSAKGLDFRHVYLVGLTADGLPGHHDDSSTSDDESTATQEMQRRLLYTAMVRACDTLEMTSVKGREHPLLKDLPLELCHRVVV